MNQIPAQGFDSSSESQQSLVPCFVSLGSSQNLLLLLLSCVAFYLLLFRGMVVLLFTKEPTDIMIHLTKDP